MSTLHTISKSPQSGILQSCLAVIGAEDAILFIEDGVYHCASPLVVENEAPRLYALREDMLARGTLGRLHDGVEPVDSARFVELCCEHDKVVSWF